MKAFFEKYTLKFRRPAKTSREVMQVKDTYFLTIEKEGKKGIGECNLFKGLSCDDLPDYEEKLDWLCGNIHLPENEIYRKLIKYPSIIFGWEQAKENLKHQGKIYFPSKFTEGEAKITINGLIWMGDVDFMQQQIQQKLTEGFRCIKLKIGVDWEKEHQILIDLRSKFPVSQLELRVDANGAFNEKNAMQVLHQLNDLQIHSIEQPIQPKNWEAMALLCEETPTPIALDEELIGIHKREEKLKMLQTIQPQYIILKPALMGGFRGSAEWIELAEELGIGWWVTSALESNIGLNALAQWTFTLQNSLPQGLGTGGLFTNNLPSPLVLSGDQLFFLKS